MEEEIKPSPYAGLAKKIRDGKSASTEDLENRPPELSISRGFDGSAGHGVVMKLALAYRNLIASDSFRVLIDDVEVGRIDQEEALKIKVAPGIHRIRIVGNVVASNVIKYDFQNGDRLKLHCRTKMTGIVLYR